MIRLLVVSGWILLIVATALTMQVAANWLLSIGLGLFLWRGWRMRHRSTSLQGPRTTSRIVTVPASRWANRSALPRNTRWR